MELPWYDACFFCLGVSSAGMSEADYTRLTFELTLGWARALARINPAMTFVYVSGRAGDRAGGGDQHRGAGARDDPRRPAGCSQAGAGKPRSARAGGGMIETRR